mgnify:CR=1 FL=1
MDINLDSNKPLISVIINCYNGEKYLRETIDSVLNQSYQNWEIIFWDNNSTDQSANILKSYKDDRIKYFYSDEHRKLYDARNLAYEKSRGDFFCFLDTDDYFLNNYFERQLKLFDDKDVGFSCSNYFYKDETKNKFWIRFKKKQSDGYILSDLLKNYNVGLPTLFVKRSALPVSEKLFDSSYTYLGDFDLVINLSASFKMARSHEPLSVYRLHENNLSNKNHLVQLQELENWYYKTKKIEKIRSDTKFSNIKNLIIYKKIIIALHEKKSFIAILLLKKVPWSFRKFKYIIILILRFGFRIKLEKFRF